MLYKRGEIWHYDFFVAGRRYRGSTKQKSQTRARIIEAAIIAEVMKRGESAIPKRAPRLCDFSKRFLDWSDMSRLKPNTKRYYRNGWKLLDHTPLRNLALSAISNDEVEKIQFRGGAAYVNQAVRTLRRMLGKAQEWKLIHVAPRLKLLEEDERNVVIDGETETRLLVHLRQPARDVFLIAQDCGLRPHEVTRMAIQDINLGARTFFNRWGKTKRSRRLVALSQRVLDLIFVRCEDRKEGWVFPSKRSKSGHVESVAKKFREAREAAGLPRSVVLYAARHTYGTFVYDATKNLKVVMDSMGHSDVRTTMRYQHPELEQVRIAIDQRNAQRHNLRHSEVLVQ